MVAERLNVTRIATLYRRHASCVRATPTPSSWLPEPGLRSDVVVLETDNSRGRECARRVRTSPFSFSRTELNGARSNPFANEKNRLARLDELHHRLLHQAATSPRQPRPAPPKPSPVLETITLVLKRAGGPMRACEIHAAAQQLAGEILLWTSVKATLARGATGPSPPFQRIRHGVYQLKPL